MSNDLVSRLRRYRAIDAHRAADEIERLRKERDEAREMVAKLNRIGGSDD